jgi:hypothetical protein
MSKFTKCAKTAEVLLAVDLDKVPFEEEFTKFFF